MHMHGVTGTLANTHLLVRSCSSPSRHLRLLHRTIPCEIWISLRFLSLSLASSLHSILSRAHGAHVRTHTHFPESIQAAEQITYSRLVCVVNLHFMISRITAASVLNIFYWHKVILTLPRSSELRCRWRERFISAINTRSRLWRFLSALTAYTNTYYTHTVTHITYLKRKKSRHPRRWLARDEVIMEIWFWWLSADSGSV